MKALLTLSLAVTGTLLGTSDLMAQTPVEVPATTTSATSSNHASAEPDTRVGGYVLDDKHKLAPGDKVSFRIIEDRDPAISLTVTDSGELNVPYLDGRVKAAGKTCKQLEGELKVLLEQEYYYRASVRIGLDAVSKFRGKVYVTGQVRTMGAIDLPAEEDFTAGKAILRAGGFGDFAKKNKVKLVRTNADGKKVEFELNMEDILEKGKTELDKSLKDGDFIIVPERTFNF